MENYFNMNLAYSLLLNVIFIYLLKQTYIYITKDIDFKETSTFGNTLYIMFPYQIGVFLFFNTLYPFLYYNDFKSLRKYRSNELDWPWKENPERFKKTIKSQIWIYLRNYFLITLAFFYLFDKIMPF